MGSAPMTPWRYTGVLVGLAAEGLPSVSGPVRYGLEVGATGVPTVTAGAIGDAPGRPGAVPRGETPGRVVWMVVREPTSGVGNSEQEKDNTKARERREEEEEKKRTRECRCGD
jgi:hypothetical protein